MYDWQPLYQWRYWQCPPTCNDGSRVLGCTNAYSANSTICAAALQTGFIDSNGGSIGVALTTGQTNFVGCTLSGVTTQSGATVSDSYIVFTDDACERAT